MRLLVYGANVLGKNRICNRLVLYFVQQHCNISGRGAGRETGNYFLFSK